MLSDPDLVSIQEVRAKVEQAYSAWTKYRRFSQEQVDSIVEAVAAAARSYAQHFAELAVKETGYGNVRDKTAKNMLAADTLPRRMRGMRTLGVLRELAEEGIVEIGEPMGVVAAILPTTNPTSTAIYKTLIALKSGNAIVLSPHPRARACTCETAALLTGAAEKAGAPQGTVQCIGSSTVEGTQELMRHRRTSVILSTGGSGIVRAAYSSGKPAFGVGPGNVPVLVDTSAKIPEAVARIMEGTTFDFGTLCSSEQTVVAERSIRDQILDAFRAGKAVVCDAAQTKALERVLIGKNFSINPDCVGQPAPKIAAMAGFEVPKDTTVLVAEIAGIGKDYPLSAEKLSPVLSLRFVDNFAAALDACEAVLRFGGLGHTCGIHAQDDARIREYAARMPAFRVIANTPAPLGSTGITTNVFPAMTLGCGAVAGNSTSDNISPFHLINIKRLAYAGEGVRSQKAAVRMGATHTEIRAAVERYLARLGASPAPAPLAAPEEKPPPVPPAVAVADFVCEDDVRQAMRESRKIFIGPKTIVTPSARDLANAHDVLVVTKGVSKKSAPAE
jgi:acyl-CoA reductase-like NAD-dependent aldehyde dehydrogenase